MSSAVATTDFPSKFESLILTHAQEKRLTKRFPYNLALVEDGQYLYYIGGNHSTNPNDEQYSIINCYWGEFVSLNEPKIVFTEGGDWEYVEDPMDAIRRNAEPMYVTHLARKCGIKCVSAEPSFKDELDYLEKIFERGLIFYFWMARYIRQWPDIEDSWPDGEEKYLQDQMVHVRKQTNWSKFDFSVKNLERIHKKIFGTPFRLEDFGHFSFVAKPSERGSIINQVAAASSRFRDIYMVRRVKKSWDAGKHIFAVLGWSHVVRQEPAIGAIVRRRY